MILEDLLGFFGEGEGFGWDVDAFFLQEIPSECPGILSGCNRGS